MLCVGYTRGALEKSCTDCYTVAKYLKAYNCVIHSLPNGNLDLRNDDENLHLYPSKDCSKGQEKIGKRKKVNLIWKKRSTTMRCDNCKRFSHNRRTYQHAPVTKKV